MATAPGQSVGDALRAVSSWASDRLALKDDRGAYTYAELCDLSDQICRLLLELGARPGDVVGLLFEQSREAVAAVLGVLKAGCCFVPLDLNDPEPRLQFIVDDCDPAFLLTSEACSSKARALDPAKGRVVELSGIEFGSAGGYDAPGVSSDAAAYIFYTSGSTGQPKGVCQTHRNLLHFAHTYGRTLEIGSEDRLSMLYSLSFSASNMDVFAGLLSGASVHLLDLKNRGPLGLHDWLAEEGITVLHTVPTVFRHLLKNAPRGLSLDTVRAIDLGGEPVYPGDVELLKAHFPSSCACFNHLAATEASVIAQHRMGDDERCSEGRIPVGHPAAGIAVRITREDGSQAANDEVGEIVVVSPYLSTGYWRRPELTEQAFFEDESRVRAYRTGDLGFVDDQGRIYHVGRSNTRIKVRGHSVDITEIESALIRHEDVENAAVVAPAADPDGEAVRLVAHIVPRPDTRVTSSVIRQFLRARLPDYMVPARIVLRGGIPLTTTGKIDRAHLSALVPTARDLDGEFVAPSTDLEKTIAYLFADLLNVEVVGLEDGFFELGGDSLLTMDLLSELRDRFGTEVAFDRFAIDPTVRGVVAAVDHEPVQGRTSSPLVPMQTAGGQPPFYFVPGGAGDDDVVGSTYSGLAKYLGQDQPFYGLVDRREQEDGEHPAVEQLAARFVDAVRAAQPHGPYYLGGGCIGGIVAFEMGRQIVSAGESVAAMILINTEVPTDEVRENLRRAQADRGKRRFRRRGRFIVGRARHHLQTLRSLEVGQRLRYLASRAGRAVVMGRQISEYNARIDSRLDKLMSAYVPGPYEGDVCLIVARPPRWSQQVGWKPYVRGRFRVYRIASQLDGENSSLSRTVGECVRARLDEARGSTVGGISTAPTEQA